MTEIDAQPPAASRAARCEDPEIRAVPMLEQIEPGAGVGAQPSPAARALVDAAQGDPLYAVVDCAQALELAVYARALGIPAFTLFVGEQAEAMSTSGPCLLSLDAQPAFLDAWLESRGSHAGILIVSRASFQELYAHLRDVFVVADEDNQEYFLRFYDPRVLRSIIDSWGPDDLARLLGPTTAWIAESPDPAGFLRVGVELSADGKPSVRAAPVPLPL